MIPVAYRRLQLSFLSVSACALCFSLTTISALLPSWDILRTRRYQHAPGGVAAAASAAAAAAPSISSILEQQLYLDETSSSQSPRNQDLLTNTTIKTTIKDIGWFPTRIQEIIDYQQVIKRLYVRHIVTETAEMARSALDQYLSMLSSPSSSSLSNVISNDPFATIAQTISACPITREQGGTIGWIDNPVVFLLGGEGDTKDSNQNNTSIPVSVESAYDSMIPSLVVDELFRLQPKAGDIHLIQSQSTQQWHLIQVLETWVNFTAATSTTTNTNTIQQQQHQSSTLSNKDLVHPNRVGSVIGKNIALSPRTRKGYGGRNQLPASSIEQLRTYSIQTWGCQMNVADSERLAGVLEHEMELQPIPSSKFTSTTPNHNRKDDDADLVLFNTCSIRDHAEQKLYDALGPYARQKRMGRSNKMLIVTGCVAQQEGEKLIQRVPEIDIVMGPQYIPFLYNIVQQVLTSGNPMVLTAPIVQPQDTDRAWGIQPIRGHTVRAYVNVIHGCNEHCTYCVVPSTRGMEISRTMESIWEECNHLIQQQGYKEITLLGQNIDAYGRDMIPKRTFADLLEFLNARLPNKTRIRYVTSHPRYFSDRVIDAVTNLDKVCECFHMPFQAGDDTVLKNMRRGYTHESYLRIIDKIRFHAPDAAICADVIVGFPGESEEAFQRTLELMEQVHFDNINSFAYSPRPNTEASLWTKDLVSDEIKSDRLRRVQDLAQIHAYERSERYLNRVVEVLVEEKNERNPNQVMGRTRQGRPVYFDGQIDNLLGELVQVQIVEARPWSLMGTRV